MEGFQKSVLTIAILILIIALVIIGISLYYSNNSSSWPPMSPSCPDYWTIDGSGNSATCTNVKDLGTCPTQSGKKHLVMNFNQAPYTGSNGLCAKYKWANNCNLSWDGVNYGVNNPCETTSS
jgi:hypothetical protein